MVRRSSYLVMLVALLGMCAFSPAAPLHAKNSSADINCATLVKLTSAPATIEQSTYLFYWVPGWWAAMHNDPYINDWRRSLLSEAIIEACRKSTQSRILDAVRSVKKLPAVPDNALKMTCKNFMDAQPPWQIMTIFWYQGYLAFQRGHTNMNSDYISIYNPVFEMCLKDESVLLEKVISKVIK